MLGTSRMTFRAILLCITTSTVAKKFPATYWHLSETVRISRRPTDFGVKLVLVCADGASPILDTAMNEDNVCSSTECLKVASSLLKFIDQKADPCENFYKFTCGSFLESKPVNINLMYNQIVDNEMRADIRQLIEADIEPHEPKAFRLAKELYKSCMNMAAIEAKGLNPLRKHLRDLGGWPVVEGDSWKEKNFDWRRTIYKVRRDGHDYEYYIGDVVGYLVRFVIEHDESHPSKQIMALRHPLGLLPRKTKEEELDRTESSLRTYYLFMVHMAQMLGADTSRARSEIRKMLSFEIELARSRSPVSKQVKPKEYNPMTIAQLNKKYPSVPWMKYIQKFVPSRIHLTDEEIINVPDPTYYVKLENLMATTAKRIQANYVMSRIALKNAVFLTEKMRKNASRILARKSYFPVRQDRPSYCAVQVTAHLWQAVTAMYANKFLDKETKDAAKAIAINLQFQLNETLRAYNWPNEEARKEALDKAARMTIHLGYPDSMLDHSKLDEVYGNIEYTEDDYFGNLNKFSNYNHEVDIKKLEEPLSELYEWGNLRAPTIVNSAYYAMENSIHISAGYLRSLFFGKNRPQYMKYGALGSSLGHEMTHASFEDGFYRGSNGKVVPFLGLGKRPEFSSRAQCLIDQYESYHVNDTGTKLNGRKTLSENLADSGGIRLAHDAYVRWAAERPEEPKLQGLERYSAKQMFWISAASIRCEKIKPERISHDIRNNEHAIDEFRVIGMMSNMPEFAEDFNCKATSLMNPAKRCDVWRS